MKLILKLSVILLIGLALLGGAGYSFLPAAARKAIEEGTGLALGTPTHLEGIEAGFGLNSTLGIAGFTADQPEGFEGPPLLEIGKIEVGVNLLSTLSDTIRIPEVTLDGLHLRLVQNGKESNFLQVYKSISKLTEAGPEDSSDSKPKAGGEESSSKNIEIGLVKVSGVGATFDLTGIPGIDQSYSFEIPAFELDLSNRANQSRMQNVEQVTAQVVGRLIEATVTKAQAQVSPELALLIGGDVEGLKARATQELDKLKGKAGAEVNKLKEKAKGDLKQKLGEELGNSLDGDKADQLNKLIENKVDDLIKKGGDSAIEGGTSDALKSEADKLIKKGSKGLRKELDGLFKKKD